MLTQRQKDYIKDTVTKLIRPTIIKIANKGYYPESMAQKIGQGDALRWLANNLTSSINADKTDLQEAEQYIVMVIDGLVHEEFATRKIYDKVFFDIND